MTGAAVERILRECELLRDGDEDSVLTAVRIAIVLEDVFGIVLTDAEIQPEVMDDPDAVRAVLARSTSRF
jgi:hypothetical protein